MDRGSDELQPFFPEGLKVHQEDQLKNKLKNQVLCHKRTNTQTAKDETDRTVGKIISAATVQLFNISFYSQHEQ